MTLAETLRKIALEHLQRKYGSNFSDILHPHDSLESPSNQTLSLTSITTPPLTKTLSTNSR